MSSSPPQLSSFTPKGPLFHIPHFAHQCRMLVPLLVHPKNVANPSSAPVFTSTTMLSMPVWLLTFLLVICSQRILGIHCNHLPSQPPVDFWAFNFWFGVLWLYVRLSNISAIQWRDSWPVSKFGPAAGQPMSWTDRVYTGRDYPDTVTGMSEDVSYLLAIRGPTRCAGMPGIESGSLDPRSSPLPLRHRGERAFWFILQVIRPKKLIVSFH